MSEHQWHDKRLDWWLRRVHKMTLLEAETVAITNSHVEGLLIAFTRGWEFAKADDRALDNRAVRSMERRGCR